MSRDGGLKDSGVSSQCHAVVADQETGPKCAACFDFGCELCNHEIAEQTERALRK